MQLQWVPLQVLENAWDRLATYVPDMACPSCLAVFKPFPLFLASVDRAPFLVFPTTIAQDSMDGLRTGAQVMEYLHDDAPRDMLAVCPDARAPVIRLRAVGRSHSHWGSTTSPFCRHGWHNPFCLYCTPTIVEELYRAGLVLDSSVTCCTVRNMSLVPYLNITEGPRQFSTPVPSDPVRQAGNCACMSCMGDY